MGACCSVTEVKESKRKAVTMEEIATNDSAISQSKLLKKDTELLSVASESERPEYSDKEDELATQTDVFKTDGTDVDLETIKSSVYYETNINEHNTELADVPAEPIASPIEITINNPNTSDKTSIDEVQLHVEERNDIETRLHTKELHVPLDFAKKPKFKSPRKNRANSNTPIDETLAQVEHVRAVSEPIENTPVAGSIPESELKTRRVASHGVNILGKVSMEELLVKQRSLNKVQ
jgi:hypothetical protein